MANAYSIRARKDSSRPKSGRRKQELSSPPDLNAIVDRLYAVQERFMHSCSFLEAGVALLDHWSEESDRPGPENASVCLRHGLELLEAGYSLLADAILSSRQAIVFVSGSKEKGASGSNHKTSNQVRGK